MSTLQTTNLKHPDTAGNQITFTSGGDVNFDNGAIYIDSTNNYLGIGTTTPARPIHLRSSTNPMLLLESSDGIADIIGADTAGSTRIRSDAGALSFWTGGDASSSNANASSQGAAIDSSGRLIVGMTSPLASTTTAYIQSASQIVAEQGVLTRNGGWSMLPTTRVTLTVGSGSTTGHTCAIDLAGLNGANHATLLRVTFAMRRGNTSSSFSQKSEYMGLWDCSKISTDEHIDATHIVTRELTVTNITYSSNVVTLTFDTDNVRSFTARAFEYCTTGALYTDAT